VTGGTGQLGSALMRQPWPKGWEPVAVTRADLDLADAGAILAMVTARRWAAVINAGAFTAVDQAEAEPLSAWTVNALAPAALAQVCRDVDIPLIHISTDYVFDGSATAPWGEGDAANPLGVYGASKRGGELAVQSIGHRHAIVRTAWLVSAHGRNFVKTMLNLAGEREDLKIVADQTGSPTSADDLAQLLVRMAMRMADDREAPTGIFHFANAGATSWHGFAEAIFAAAAVRGKPSPRISPIASSEYPARARRPAYSVLATTRIEQSYGVRPRSWQAALDDILDELIGPKI